MPQATINAIGQDQRPATTTFDLMVSEDLGPETIARIVADAINAYDERVRAVAGTVKLDE